jgi:hypothetical protein
MTLTQMNQWNNIPIKEPKGIRTPKSYDVIEIAKWAYIVELESFVLIDDPLKTLRNKDQFNDSFPHLKIPNGIKPETYIKTDHANTRVFDRMQLMPDRKERVVTDENNLKILNLFRQPPKAPANLNANSGMALDFFKYFFHGDTEAMEHTFKWMAHFLFVPQQKIQHALMFSSGQGTGKGTIATMLQKLADEDEAHLTADQLKGQHQSWFINRRLIRIEEVKEYNDNNFYNKIKTYFTEPFYTVNPKHKNPFQYKNISCFFLASNWINPIALESDDRRFFYFHSKAKKRPAEYWTDLNKYLFQDGGMWAFKDYLEKHYLPQLDIKTFAFDKPYQTEWHKMSCLASSGRLADFIEDLKLKQEGYYQKNKFFLFENFKRDLHENNGISILRNDHLTNAQLAQAGLMYKEYRSQRLFGDNNRRKICWWDYSSAHLEPLFNSKTKFARDLLDKSYLDNEHDIPPLYEWDENAELNEPQQLELFSVEENFNEWVL